MARLPRPEAAAAQEFPPRNPIVTYRDDAAFFVLVFSTSARTLRKISN
jgi:hypothetical protein